MPETRMTFIPELKAMITKNLLRQVTAAQIDDAFVRWEAGDEPMTPAERGCFEVFRQVQADIG